MTKDEHPGTAAAEEDEDPPEDEASSAQPEAEAYSESSGRMASEGPDEEEGMEPMTENEHPETAAAEEAEELPEDEASSAQPEAEVYLQSPGRLASEGPDDEVGMEPMTEDEHPGTLAAEDAEITPEDEASSAQPDAEAWSESPGRLASEGLDGEEGIEPMTEDEHAGTAAAEEAEEAEELPEDEASSAQPEAEVYLQSHGRLASEGPDDEVETEPMTKDEHPGTAAAEEAEKTPEDEASSAQSEAEAYSESPGMLALQAPDHEEGMQPMTKDEQPTTVWRPWLRSRGWVPTVLRGLQ